MTASCRSQGWRLLQPRGALWRGRQSDAALPRPRVQLREGLVKPDPAIYRHVLEQLRCASSDALLVGDTPAADVNGPSDLSSLPRLNRHYTRAAVL